MNLLKLIFAPHKLVGMFTFYAGGGVGEAALIGAAVGGGTALISGNDPLKGALVGGITGGVGGAVMGAGAGALGSAATEGAATAVAPSVVDATAAAGTQAAANLAPSMVQAPSAGITGLLDANVPAASTGIGNFGAANVGTQAVADVVNPATQVADLNLVPQVNLGNTAQFMDGGARVAQQAAEPGMMDRLGGWYKGLSTPEKIGLGIAGGVGLNALSQKEMQMPLVEENPMGFATYDRSKFTPYSPTPNVYRPGYAGGGIAALAPNGMYPQGQQDHTQYATPSQMPTSAEVINADYEQATNPYTGNPVGYADGGTVSKEAIDNYLKGSMSRTVDPAAAQAAQAAQNAVQTVSQPTKPAGRTNNQFGIGNSLYSPSLSVDQRAALNYGPGHYSMAGWVSDANPYGTAASYGSGWINNQADYWNNVNRMLGGAAPESAMASNFQTYPTAATPNANIYRPGYAEGGIAGFNLGGYADGGNPRLLKGPGTGISDDIPAIIGDKQPARLASGEFVVPARIVSELGQGSTDAGARELYKMMDRVQASRKKTIGKGKFSNNSKAEKHLPA